MRKLKNCKMKTSLGQLAMGLFVFVFSAFSAVGQTPAFPGAAGFGKFTTGGRGGNVLHVTNTNDDGPGSLRSAIEAKGPRTIVFDVSGTIELKSRLAIDNGDLTIAGQTAPGDGICIRNYPVGISADNIIIRYLRFRLGNARHVEADAIGGTKHTNIIIDHCSMSWATDECASFYRNKNFTLQWCIISESLNASVHLKGEHGYGGIWGGEGASYHHNLLAHHKSRMPRFSGSATTVNPDDELVDFSNNVIYNWGANNTYGGERGRYNMTNNYYKAGPATSKKISNRIVNPSSPYGLFYIDGNHVEGFPEITANNWNGGVHCDNKDSAKSATPFTVECINPESAVLAFEKVLQSAGASLKRDAIDTRIMEEVKTGTASKGKKQNGIIDTPEEAGGYPELKSTPAPLDTDRDGIPDVWEKKNGLDPQDPADAKRISIDKKYTNLEVYLNSIIK